MSKAKTPYELMGYKKGQKFSIKEGDNWVGSGETAMLLADDGSTNPLFQILEQHDDWYVELSNLEPIEE